MIATLACAIANPCRTCQGDAVDTCCLVNPGALKFPLAFGNSSICGPVAVTAVILRAWNQLRAEIKHVSVVAGHDNQALGFRSQSQQIPETADRVAGPEKVDLIATVQMVIDGVDHHRDHTALSVSDGTPHFGGDAALGIVGQVALLE